MKPNRRVLQPTCSPVLERSLILNQNRRVIKKSFTWTTLNFIFIAIILYDLSYACPYYFNYLLYLEYSLLVILTLNFFYHIVKIARLSLSFSEPILITPEQKVLLNVKDSDPDYKICQSPTKSINSTPVNSFANTPGTISSVSQLSNVSQLDSINFSISSPSWTYLKCTPETNTTRFSNRSPPNSASKTSSMKTSFCEASSVEFITDENSLNKYLKEYEEMEKVQKLANKSQQSSNLLSSFWSHPVTKTAKDVSSFLKKCQYQLSSQLATKSPGSPNIKGDGKITSSQISALEVWTRINVDSVALTQWNENLRVWISQTIIERLVKEFDSINDSLDTHGLSDIKIGGVGLERLRKTAQTSAVAQFIPSLPTLLPFLEITANQEYLVKRIRELARGGCISEFKWNGGGTYNGKDWDVSLPTDCAIVMHLLASYLDTQLMPLPSMPDTKAFSGHHYIRASEKLPDLTKNSLFIHQVSEQPPHYRVIVAGKVYEMVKGYNNLFHSILFFIYHVNKIELGMLGRVNLGRAGVNILWVIDQ
ncbi:transmembrane protein 209 isoform X2 [Leptinotarsa decemlineata]|uniref:transmembrane protein 209 isoform X2 n=1 Tax=Leptinotarsa decemlineata TaxID=7539 RepID=UPI000C2558FC|nr:transmembrane protein 209 isoform X2 [Leptinotarsa decemlineata]